MKRRTEIIVEVELVRTAALITPEKIAWCDKCGREVAVGAPEKAARIAGTRVRLIYRWLEAGLLHFREDQSGGIAICLESLPQVGSDK